ncbi:Homeobox-leucine zipper protein ATHB-17, partial [Mucuna pruriens]
ILLLFFITTVIFCVPSMAVLPSSSSSLELTISVPGFASSPTLLPSSSVHIYKAVFGITVKELDMNQVPLEEDWMTSNMEDEDESSNGDPPRKKLRLTKEQSRLLEESFRQNHTLNPKQKESLAMQLKLRPRQVEVWFQNRRARDAMQCRSKLKQTEMECEYLKRWFGSLSEQNRRLQREVEELRAMKVGPPTVISPHSCEPLPASTLTMCPRCERVTTTTDKALAAAATLSAKVPAPALQSRQPSAAC